MSSGLLSVLCSDWLSDYRAICYSPLVAKSLVSSHVSDVFAAKKGFKSNSYFIIYLFYLGFFLLRSIPITD